MSLKHRMNKLIEKLNNKSIGQDVNGLVLDLFLPAIDEETGETLTMSKVEAVEWIDKRGQVARLDDSGTFDDAVLSVNEWSEGDFLAGIAPDYPKWPDNLIEYKAETNCVLSAHLMSQHGIL